MPKYSEQDLKYAAEFREEIHREALAIIRKTRPNAAEVIDRHPVEDYFQEHWDYPGKWYTIVAIPYGYKSRKALVDTIVRDTLSGKAPEAEPAYTQTLRDMTKAGWNRKKLTNQLDGKPDDYQELFVVEIDQKNRSFRAVGVDAKGRYIKDSFYQLLAEYPDLALDYCIVKEKQYHGYESHRRALKVAYHRLCGDWKGNPDQAAGKSIAAEEMFSSAYQPGRLNYRKAFLYPPHENHYTGKDFVRVNAALFPNGTDGLEVYEWTTDWSDYFDEGHEWWGALCLTVYDNTLDRFVVIMASATD